MPDSEALQARPPRAILTPSEKQLLRGCAFRSVNFRGLDFSKSDLRGCQLSKVVFLCCDLSDSDLRGARFLDCRLVACDLDAVRLGSNIFTRSAVANCRGLSTLQKTYIRGKGGEVDKRAPAPRRRREPSRS